MILARGIQDYRDQLSFSGKAQYNSGDPRITFR